MIEAYLRDRKLTRATLLNVDLQIGRAINSGVLSSDELYKIRLARQIFSDITEGFTQATNKEIERAELL